MNTTVREFLIDMAHKKRHITYEEVSRACNLGIDHTDGLYFSGEIGRILGEISTFEFEHDRPLISSIVIGKNESVQGDGFFRLAEELGIGSQQKLKRDFFGAEEMRKSFDFWSDPMHYSQSKSIATSTQENKHPKFFTRGEIEFLSNWAGQVYDKKNAEHVAAKNFIMESVWNKTIYWSDQIKKELPNFDSFCWRMWSQHGWINGNDKKVPIARFKHYTWARIFKTGDDKKDIFFTVGVDGEKLALVYKLDYYFEATSFLNQAQKDILSRNIPQNLRWNEIPLSELSSHDWDSLIELTVLFISKHTNLYDSLIDAVWNGKVVETALRDNLIQQPLPPGGLSNLPVLNPSFKGIIKNFNEEDEQNKSLGDAGEVLVIQYEKARLCASGKQNLADKVRPMLVGEGYDVISYDSSGNEKYIEVKTTCGNEKTPFHLSLNEYLFAERNVGSYFIYRLYNYDNEKNTALFFELDNPLEQLLLQPIDYRAYYKKPNI